MKTHKFECDDRYEAEKLASLVSVQKDGTVWLSGVAAVVGKEIVVQLKDRSSHSVILRDNVAAERLGDLLSQVLIGRWAIRSSGTSGSVAEIVVD
jgi:hypothetical protein